MNADILTVDVVSDMVCPWCYIGKHRLEEALRELAVRAPSLRTGVRWHPFQLNPDLPPEGMDRRAYLEAKFGGAQGAARRYDDVRRAAAETGLTLELDAIARQPNTLDAHRLVAWTQASGANASALVERLFRAYFVEGRRIGEPDTLVDIAAGLGMDRDAVRAFVESDELRDDVAASDERVRSLGINGVPFFVFNSRVALSGAHESATLLDAIEQARTPAA